MRHYNEVRPKDKKAAYGAVAIYLIVLIATPFFVEFSFSDDILQEPPYEGILITIGDMGEEQGVSSKASSMANAEEGETVSAVEPDVEVAPDNDMAVDAVVESPAEKKAATVNTSALYKSNSGSQNPTSDEKNATGTATSGSDSYDNFDNKVSLAGRHIVGSLPHPRYLSDGQGTIVIEIHVNQAGKVTRAAFMAKGSTTNDSKLIDEALKAARRAIFNVDGQSSVVQAGTITYLFNLR